MFALSRLTTFPALLLAMLLVFVLVMTQTLGVMHTITHGSLGSSLQSQDDGHDHNHAEAKAPAASHFLASLFSSHRDVSDCRLYDQTSHDGAMVTAVQSTLPVVLPPFTVAIFQGEALARWAALFDARGPPLTV